MQTKLRKVGTSLGVSLPKDVIDRLGLKEGDQLNIAITSEGIILYPYNPDVEACLNAAEETTAEYQNALKAPA